MLGQSSQPRKKLWLIGLVGLLAVVTIVSVLVEGRREIPLPPLLRITTNPESNVQHLEVPLLHYEKGAGLGDRARVDFVGAVHLGGAAYYRDLNQRFTTYDAVLFELVSDGHNLPAPGEPPQDSILGTVQRGLCALLGLSFQLDEINYKAKNFVHADLSPQELGKAMAARGESLPQLLIKLFTLSTDPEVQRALERGGYNEKALEGINPLLILLRGPTAEERIKLRRFMAQGLVASDGVLKILEGEKGFSLITDRNIEVMSVLDEESASGRNNLAIFYGVGHLPDLHKRLQERGYRLSKVEWLTVWDM